LVARQYGQYDFENTATGFSSMIFWALVFAADIFAALIGVELKNRRRNEMLGNCFSFDLLEWDYSSRGSGSLNVCNY